MMADAELIAGAKIVARADLVVVGGGPAGIAAAVSGARAGLSTVLLERYPYLGGLASGGMVLVLDDMCNGAEVTVRGLCGEMIDRMTAMGLCVVPPEPERLSDPAMWRKWARWGLHDFYSSVEPQPICYAAAFDPDGFKRAANAMIAEAKVNLRLHSWFSRAIVEDGRITGVVSETKAGPQAVMGSVVVDATGDLDVAVSAGAAHTSGSFIVTTVFRLGGVDVARAERFEYDDPEAYKATDREAKRIIGGAWEHWWLKTPLPGILWCNCPHMVGFDGTSVEDLTRADAQGRARIEALVTYARASIPGFENAFVVDVAPQLGVRQSRLLDGTYVVTKDDVVQRRHFPDTVARGRDYYTPYRALLPRDVRQLLVAGRHYSATGSAQRLSREIPPCMAMGEAAGLAAAMALEAGIDVSKVDVPKLQVRLRAQGADPGDRPSANATVEAAAA
jgi:hypothetical protein